MIRTTVLVVGLMSSAVSASTTVLYDGSLGTAPAAQGSLFTFVTAGGSSTTAGNATTFNSSASPGIQGGYSTHTPIVNTPVNPSLPSFSVAGGLDVRVDATLLSEQHQSNHRAGLSLIVIGSDLRGIELGFWTDRIWAQSGPDFQQAEGVAVDTTSAAQYVLSLNASNGGSYALKRNGASILSGSLRNYSSFGAPYSLPSYVFLGDNTTSAAGEFRFSHLSVTVPEPTALALVAFALPLLSRRRRG